MMEISSKSNVSKNLEVYSKPTRANLKILTKCVFRSAFLLAIISPNTYFLTTFIKEKKNVLHIKFGKCWLHTIKMYF